MSQKHVKSFFFNYLEVNQDSSLKEDELRPHYHTDGTQTQSPGEAESTAVHFAVNSKLQTFSKSHEYQQNIRH